MTKDDKIKINLYFLKGRDRELFDFVFDLLKDVPPRQRAAAFRREICSLWRAVKESRLPER